MIHNCSAKATIYLPTRELSLDIFRSHLNAATFHTIALAAGTSLQIPDIHMSVPDIHVSVVSTHQYLLWASLVCLTWIRCTDVSLMMSNFLLFLRVSHHRLWWVAFVLLVYTAAPPTAMAAAAAAKRVMMMKLLRRNICFVRYFALCLALIQELLIIPKSIKILSTDRS